MKFPEKLQLLMANSGETRESLGKALGIAHTTVGRWLDGTKPRPKVTTQIATYFGIPIQTLIDDNVVLPLLEPQITSVRKVENAPMTGFQLAEKWHQLPQSTRLKIADQIVDHLAKNITD